MEETAAFAVFDSPVGPLYGRADDGAVTALSFTSRRPIQSRRGTEYKPSRDAIAAVEAQIGEYFACRRTTFDLPLALVGPPFHVRVWEALRAIPYGETVAYGELAQSIGEADAARAVGAANGANPIVIIVPCHRVIGANGRLVGYGGGLHRKRVLLDLESGRTTLDLAPCAALREYHVVSGPTGMGTITEISRLGRQSMRTAIDLKVEPPRSGREMLGGFAWLARMTDKARAKHAGTEGDYVSPCPMDEGFLKRSGVAAAEYMELIASENDDEQVASYFERHVGPTQREAANDWILVENSQHLDELDTEEGRPL